MMAPESHQIFSTWILPGWLRLRKPATDAELDGYFAAESDPDAEDPLVLDEFFTPAVDAFRLEEGKMGIGPLFGVPKDFTTVGIYWNRRPL